MLTNYHTLTYIAAGLKSKLEGQTLAEAFTQHRDELVLRCRGVDDALVISCDRDFNTLYLRPHFSRARANSTNVLARCIEQRIVEIRMHPRDRVVTFCLSAGDRLDALFFGAKANVVVLDRNQIVCDAFKDANHVVGSKAEYRGGEIVYDAANAHSLVAAAKLPTMFAAMKDAYPTLGATLVKEILHRAGISSTSNPATLHEEQRETLHRALLSVLNDLAAPLPRVYLADDGSPIQFSLVPLVHHDDLVERRFVDVHEAIRFVVARTRSREFIDHEKRSIVAKLQQKLSKAKRTVEAVEYDLASSERAEEHQKFGELLMAHLHRVETRAKSVELEGVEIPLQKDLSAVQNAQKYFEKAKRARSALHKAAERRRELHATIAPAERLLALLEEVNSKEELKKFMSKHNDELERFGIGEKSEAREQLPFRVFTVDGGFEVWAGKSSKNNDELTLKHAKPNDLWFHARGAAGSHVVLKVNSGKGEPSKRAREQAASIAAYYSKMKNAKMVPVAMTEKKFVRKPKGAAPGSVTVEREKVIFAEPALPDDMEEGKRKKGK